MAENLADVDSCPDENDVVRLVEDPLSDNGGLVVLHGNLAPDGCVLIVVSDTNSEHASPDPPKSLTKKSKSWPHSSDAKSTSGDVVMIRYEGSKDGPVNERDARIDQARASDKYWERKSGSSPMDASQTLHTAP